jgi:hypothetical protein
MKELLNIVTPLHRKTSRDYVGRMNDGKVECMEVARNKYLVVESYRSELELFNLQCWALTCESFYDPREWVWLFNEFGYTGDYEFIYFE